MNRRTKWRLAYGSLLVLALSAEAYGVASTGTDGDTISEFTRWLLQTDTQIGRAVFAAGWTGFAAWYLVHILKYPKDK